MKKTTLTVYMDDQGHEVPKEQATRFMILTVDENGKRIREAFGEAGPGP